MYVGKEEPDVGRRTRFGPDVFWARKVEQMFYDARTPHQYRARIMHLLRTLEKVKGPEYMRRLSDVTLYDLVKTFAKRFELQRHIDQTRLGQPGTSGAHKDPGVQTWHPDASFQAGLSLAHETPHRLTAAEMEGHYHPDVQKMYRAVRKDKAGHMRDGAVVWDSEDRPYYVFVRLYKGTPGDVPARDDGTRDYEVVLPITMDFRSGRAISEDDWKKYHKGRGLKDTDFRRVMRKAHTMSVLQKVNAHVFEDIILPLQMKAWKRASVFWHWWGLYQDSLKDIEDLEHKAIRGMLSPEEQKQLKAGHLVHDIRKDILLGKMPQAGHPDETEMRKWHISKQLMGESYTWYLWLLVSEQEYGIRVTERKAMYPQYSSDPTELKGEKPFWAIRLKKQEGGERKWDKTLVKGLGYSGATGWGDFISDLASSSYRGAGSEGERQRIWVPVVSSAKLKRWGMKFHHVNITDYLNLARSMGGVQKSTGPLAGKIGGKLDVHKLENIPQYVFIPPGGARKLALVPALGYLQKFDSPTHGGERLIHGRHDFEPPTYNRATGGKLPDKVRGSQHRVGSPITDKTRARADARRAKKFAQIGRSSYRYDPKTDKEELRQSLALASKIISQRKLARAKKARLKRQKIRIDKYGKFQRDLRRKSVVHRTELRPSARFDIDKRIRRMEMLARRSGRIVRTGKHKVRFKSRTITPRFKMSKQKGT